MGSNANRLALPLLGSRPILDKERGPVKRSVEAAGGDGGGGRGEKSADMRPGPSCHSWEGLVSLVREEGRTAASVVRQIVWISVDKHIRFC